MITKHAELAQRVANQFAEQAEVEAIALSGSFSGSHTDAASDIDLYVYTSSDISLEIREKIVSRSGGASHANIGLNFWGPGDEWFDAATGIEVDIIYFDIRWMADQISRVMLDYHPSLGFSTCFAFTVQHSQVFYDPNRWLAGLQEICQQPYPEPLREKIITHNHPVLREIIPSYFFQLEKAVKRGDLVSVNHRLAGLFASYFDIIFALNWELHPGEKRMLEKAITRCEKLPANMETNIVAVLKNCVQGDAIFLADVAKLLDHLDRLLEMEGFSAANDEYSLSKG